jgi:hypothetical protein
MTKTFSLTTIAPDLRSDLQTLADLTGNEICITEMISIEVTNDRLVPIIERMLGTQYPKPTINPGAFEPTDLNQELCPGCGQPFTRNHKQQKFCHRHECQAARQNAWNQKVRQAKKAITPDEQKVEVEPEAPAPFAQK